MIKRQLKSHSVIAALLASVLAAAAHAADPACAPINNAMSKLLMTPNHQFATQTAPAAMGGTTTSELINTGTARYLMYKGRWIVSPLTTKMLMDQEQENLRDAKVVNCRYVRDEPVNGEAAALYGMHDETEAGKADLQLWVSKGKGLPLRLEEDIQPDKLPNKNHISTRYVYAGIQAPAPTYLPNL